MFENTSASTVNNFVVNKLVKLMVLWTTGSRSLKACLNEFYTSIATKRDTKTNTINLLKISNKEPVYNMVGDIMGIFLYDLYILYPHKLCWGSLGV